MEYPAKITLTDEGFSIEFRDMPGVKIHAEKIDNTTPSPEVIASLAQTVLSMTIKEFLRRGWDIPVPSAALAGGIMVPLVYEDDPEDMERIDLGEQK